MKRKIDHAVIGTALAIYMLSISPPAVGGKITCPESIAETPAVTVDDKQWTAVTKSGDRPLEGVGVYLGTLSEHGAQVPDSTKKAKRKEIVTWKIKRAPADAFWVGCSYVGTTAMLFQALAPSVTVCVAEYDLLPSGKRQRLSSVNCR